MFNITNKIIGSVPKLIIGRSNRVISTTRHNLAIQSTVNIFDRNAKQLQKERSVRLPDSDLFDYIKEEVGFRVSDRIFDIKRQFQTAADIGCNKGFVSRHVLADTIDHLIVCDTNQSMLDRAEGTPGLKITKKLLTNEILDFEKNSLDLVISSLALHWVNDLPGCFSSVLNSLKPDGVFIASLFGGETLFELRSSLQLAEVERKGGISPHISPFAQIRDVGALLNRAGFTMLTIDTDEVVVRFPTMFELMVDLKGMGENNAAFNRPLHISRDTLMAAAAIYQEMYGGDEKEGIPATFQIIYLLGWKPDASQPKPLARGSADVSLKELGTIIEQGGRVTKKTKE